MARERSHIKVYVCEKPPQNHEINNSTAYPRAFFRILTKSISTEDITAERDVRSPTINCWSDLTDIPLTYYINHSSLVLRFWVCTLPSRFLLLVPTETAWIWGCCCWCIRKGTEGQRECCCAGCCVCCDCGISECGRWATMGSLLSCRLESIHNPPSDRRRRYGLVKWLRQ